MLDNKFGVDEWLRMRMTRESGLMPDLVKYGRTQLRGIQIRLEDGAGVRPQAKTYRAGPFDPLEEPTMAALGLLPDWDLYLVNIRRRGEVWLNFINIKMGLYEMWQAVDEETGGPICQMKIWLARDHYYDYRYCVEKEETTLIERWRTTEKGRPTLVTTITKDGQILMTDEL